LGRQNHPEPRVIHTDGHGAYPPAVARLKDEGALDQSCRHRVGRYLNNLVEQDHRAIKRRVKASQHFRSFWGAWRTLAGYEAVAMLRKGQAFGCSVNGGAVPLHAFIVSMFGFEG
jgi:transposase-like protein